MDGVPLVDTKVKPDKEELKLAKSLVGSMATSLKKIDLKDRYHGALREMIRTKVDGKEIVTVEEEEDKPVVDIMTALKQSIEQAKSKKKPMVKARGKKAAAPRAKASKKTTAKKTKTKTKTRKRNSA
jgi:DNA end-binding protein Ku